MPATWKVCWNVDIWFSSGCGGALGVVVSASAVEPPGRAGEIAGLARGLRGELLVRGNLGRSLSGRGSQPRGRHHCTDGGDRRRADEGRRVPIGEPDEVGGAVAAE